MLKYTDDQIRDRSSARIGKGRRPNAWWGWTSGSDCMAGMADLLGFRTNRFSTRPSEISIAAFRATLGWDEVPIDQARPGMLVAEYWPDSDRAPRTSRVPNHIELIHSIDHDRGTITTDSANTGPRPGQSEPRNYYRKTRTLTRDNFLFGIVVPAKGAPASSPYGAKTPVSLAKRKVKVTAAWLNEWADRNHLNLHTTAADDGIPGPVYWDLVQKWGRKQGIYGPGYLNDRIPGPRTRNVEAVAYTRATGK